MICTPKMVIQIIKNLGCYLYSINHESCSLVYFRHPQHAQANITEMLYFFTLPRGLFVNRKKSLCLANFGRPLKGYRFLRQIGSDMHQ